MRCCYQDRMLIDPSRAKGEPIAPRGYRSCIRTNRQIRCLPSSLCKANSTESVVQNRRPRRCSNHDCELGWADNSAYVFANTLIASVWLDALLRLLWSFRSVFPRYSANLADFDIRVSEFLPWVVESVGRPSSSLVQGRIRCLTGCRV